jgi:hypothetical protein
MIVIVKMVQVWFRFMLNLSGREPVWFVSGTSLKHASVSSAFNANFKYVIRLDSNDGSSNQNPRKFSQNGL